MRQAKLLLLCGSRSSSRKCSSRHLEHPHKHSTTWPHPGPSLAEQDEVCWWEYITWTYLSVQGGSLQWVGSVSPSAWELPLARGSRTSGAAAPLLAGTDCCTFVSAHTQLSLYSFHVKKLLCCSKILWVWLA